MVIMAQSQQLFSVIVPVKTIQTFVKVSVKLLGTYGLAVFKAKLGVRGSIAMLLKEHLFFYFYEHFVRASFSITYLGKDNSFAFLAYINHDDLPWYPLVKYLPWSVERDEFVAVTPRREN